jgi:hypothetical protein
MRSFAAHLIATQLTEKTIRRHMDNLWLLGGEVIRRVSDNDQHHISPLAALLECIDSSGGPYCQHIDSEWARDSFDATCRKFYKFLKCDDGCAYDQRERHPMPGENDEDAHSLYETACCGCDAFTRTDDIGLCEECAGKLDRDMIRQRAWDYSATVFAVPPERREELRSAVIRQYGKDLELVAPDVPERPATKGRKEHAKGKKHGKSR